MMCVHTNLLPKRMLTPTLILAFTFITTSQSFYTPSTIPKQRTSLTPPLRRTTSTLYSQREKYNVFKELMSGLTSSLLSTSSTTTTNPQLDTQILSTVPHTWDEIQSELTKLQTPDERSFRSNLTKGIGQPSPLNTIRLFDSNTPESSEIRVTFYRDSASWCPYCQKVWMTLEEKRIPYRITKVNMKCYGEKPAAFLRMQPSGQIPVAEIDGVVYHQSNDILAVLERKFSDYKSLDPQQGETEKARELLRLERMIFGAWMYWLTGSREPERYRSEFMEVLDEVETELRRANAKPGSKGFFLGDRVTIVDFQFAPFLERMAASLLYFKGFQLRVPPGVDTPYVQLNKWFDAMETLESYRLTKSDYYTHCWDLPPQLGGCTYEPEGEAYEKAINGERSLDGTGGSWELPLQPHNGGIEPDWDWCGDDTAAKREAVERLSYNHENVVAFAARGAGKAGFPPYSAALADPNAVPSEAVKTSVDAVLRVVAMAMLKGVDDDSVDGTMEELAGVIKSGGDEEFRVGVVKSVAYLRDRVGVPRDMRLPAARNLRAHLNWALGKILD